MFYLILVFILIQNLCDIEYSRANERYFRVNVLWGTKWEFYNNTIQSRLQQTPQKYVYQYVFGTFY